MPLLQIFKVSFVVLQGVVHEFSVFTQIVDVAVELLQTHLAVGCTVGREQYVSQVFSRGV